MRDALAAFITGDAIGNLTFFGPVASESTKAMVVRRQLPTISALSSIALENIFYALSVAVMVLAGALVFAEAFPREHADAAHHARQRRGRAGAGRRRRSSSSTAGRGC